MMEAKILDAVYESQRDNVIDGGVTNRLRFVSYTQSGLYDQDAASGIFSNNEVISIATGPLPIDEWGA